MVSGTRWDAEAGGWRGFTARRLQGAWFVERAPESLGAVDLRDLTALPDGRVVVVGSRTTRSLAAWVRPGPDRPSALGTPSRAMTSGAAVLADPAPSTRTLAAGHPPDADEHSPEPEPKSESGPEPTPEPKSESEPEPKSESESEPEPTPEPKSESEPEPTPSPKPTPTADRRPAAAPRPAAGPRAVVARDRTTKAGLTRTTSTYGAVRADFDDDRWPDLFIGRHSGTGWLVLNDEGRFRTSEAVFRDRDRHGCTAGDANADGRMDLYCAIGASRGAGLQVDELMLQRADGTFIDRSVELGAADPLGRGRLATSFDHDAFAGLFVADRPDRPDGIRSRHHVLANPGGDGYRSRSVTGFDIGSGADCIRAADLDRDGWQDIVLCARSDRPGGYGLRLLRNVRGRLVDITAASGIPRARALDVAIGDMDGDRRPDLVQVASRQLRVHLPRGKRYELAYTRALTNGVAVAIGDVDGDGDRDLYVVQGSSTTQRPDLLLRNGGMDAASSDSRPLASSADRRSR